jgi:endo-alpha-1,4-polygalactosaminidase (GH114 family)
MQFSHVLIEKVDSFFYFHEDCRDKMSHLKESIDEDEYVTINNSHKNARKQRFNIIHEDVASSSFEEKSRTQSILISLTRRFKSFTNVTIANEFFHNLMHAELLIRTIH